ncbi:MAG TPA: branched-chain amino acid ABC transporter permease [Thermodesulfobacteriota bacterium]
MSAVLLGQALVGGLLTGAVYSLMAVGLSLIFGVMRVTNFAHGELMMVGMYVTVFASAASGLDPYLTLPAAAVSLFVVGYLLQRVLVGRVLEMPEEIQVLLLVGVALVLQNGALFLFGPNHRGVQTPLALAALPLGPLTVDVARLVAGGLAVALTGALALFLGRSRLGTLLRAAADSRDGARIVGADVNRLYGVAYGLGAACAGTAGALIVPFFEVAPDVALPFTLTSFVVVILGGMGSLAGAFVGGLVVGVAEAIGAVVFAPSLKPVVAFGLLVLILVVRPTGLLGRA